MNGSYEALCGQVDRMQVLVQLRAMLTIGKLAGDP
jgi:hypothetical protein